jgi:hypothetical protein
MTEEPRNDATLADTHGLSGLFHPDYPGREFPDGWSKLFQEILEEWLSVSAPPIRRAKEKYGTLWITAIDQTHLEARRLRLEAMIRSEHTCEVCGGVGHRAQIGGCVSTLCNLHETEAGSP